MNTSKQINIMVALIFAAIVATGAYTIWDPERASEAKDRQTESAIERGAYLYSQNCRICHGDAGEGGAASNRVRIAPALDRDDFQGIDPATGEVREQTKTRQFNLVVNIITCGRIGTDMPTWGQTQGGPLNDEQIRQLATLITEGTGWEHAKEFALHGVEVAAIHGDIQEVHLAEALDEEALSFRLTDASIFSKGERIQIGEELMLITTVGAVVVERGNDAEAHDADAEIGIERDEEPTIESADNGRPAAPAPAPPTITAALNASSTELVVSAPNRFRAGDRLTIDGEVMTVTEVNLNKLFVEERGLGTTDAEAHSTDDEILKPPTPADPPSITQPTCGQNLPPDRAETPPPPPATDITIVAENIAWNTDKLSAVAGQPLTITVDHRDAGVQHNWHLTAGAEPGGGEVPNGGEELTATEIEPGPVTQTLDFGPLDEGDYYYLCDVHPNMEGVLTAYAPGTGPDASASPEADATPATDATAAPATTPVAQATESP